jgi:hypothetical protein
VTPRFSSEEARPVDPQRLRSTSLILDEEAEQAAVSRPDFSSILSLPVGIGNIPQSLASCALME